MKKYLIVLALFASAVTAIVATMGCTKTAEPVPTPTVTPTATALPTVVIETFTTAGSTGGWERPNPVYNSELAFSGIGWDGTQGHNAAGSVSCTADFQAGVLGKSKGDIKLEPAVYASLNLTGKTISAWIKVPQAMVDAAVYRVSVYLLDDAHIWRSGGYITITAADWTQYSVAVSDMTSAGGNDPSKTYKLGIRIDRSDDAAPDAAKNVTGPVYFDDIQY